MDGVNSSGRIVRSWAGNVAYPMDGLRQPETVEELARSGADVMTKMSRRSSQLKNVSQKR
jgi:hypothetical protein